MIELTTTVAMLVSSVLAPVSLQASTTPVIASTTPAVVVAASTTDPVKDVRGYLAKEYVDEPILISIAGCESSFRQYTKDGEVIHGKVNADDVGVMQINEKYHLEKAQAMGFDILTTEGNVAYAKYLYQTQGAAPWSASEKCWSKSSDELAMK